MSILFLSDTQIGVGTVTLDDQRQVLDRIVRVALDRKVDLVVHGGDLYEGPVVSPEHIRLFLDATEPLRHNEIPVVVVKGNGRHDMAVRSVHALDVLREIPGFFVADRPEVVMAGGVGVCALPWVHPGRLLARMNGSVDHHRVNQAITGILVDSAKVLYQALRDEGDVPAILVAHWSITGAKLPSGIPVEEMSEPVLPWADLDAIGYDLIAGAHIHEAQMLSSASIDHSAGFVIGSPQQLNFGEKGDHGCWVVEFDTDAPPEFIPIPSKEFITLDFDHDDPLAQLAFSEQVGWEIPFGASVRVRMSLSEQQLQELDQQALRANLLDAGAGNVRLDLDVQRETRRRVEVSEQLTAPQAMQLYCEAMDMDGPLWKALVVKISEWSRE